MTRILLSVALTVAAATLPGFAGPAEAGHHSGAEAGHFTGTITDSMCDRADHSRMRMGPTDSECAVACAEEHDAAFVLYDGKDVYALSDQKSARKFAGRKVTIVGALDAKTRTITVRSITPAK